MVLGVSSESGSQLKPFVEKFKTEYPVVGATRAGSHYGVRAYPTYYLVSPSGRILAGPTHGKFSDDVLKSALRSVVLFPEVPESSRLASLAKASAKANVVEVSKALARLAGLDPARGRHLEPLLAARLRLHLGHFHLPSGTVVGPRASACQGGRTRGVSAPYRRRARSRQGGLAPPALIRDRR